MPDFDAERDRLPAVLAEPTRRRIHALLGDGVPRSRSAVAAELRLPRSTAAFHLERLAAAGLVRAESRRVNGRSGPGAGRPTKLYRRIEEPDGATQHALAGLAGLVMAEAIELAALGAAPRSALRTAAGEAGRRLAAGSGPCELATALSTAGYTPRDDAGDLVLGSCPFHRLAQARPGVICELNHALVQGLAAELGEAPERVLLDAGAGECCLRVRGEARVPRRATDSQAASSER